MQRVRSVFAVAAIAAVAAAVPVAADDAAPSLLGLTQSARTKRAAGDVLGASKDLTAALELVPRNASLLHERAQCRALLGDVKGTVQDLKKAEEISPADYPLDLGVWRSAVERSRAEHGAKEPDLRLIQAEISRIRGKPFKRDVESGTQSPKEFGEAVDRSIDEEMPRDRRGDVQAGLKRLGLVPDGFDLRSEVTGALMSQAAAYYDPKQGKFFNLFSGMPPELVETTAAHELVHALQDQYFPLDKWFAEHEGSGPDVRDDDRILALRCVVEGEATFVQMVWQLEHAMHQPPEQALFAARAGAPLVAELDTEDLVRLAKAQPRLAAPGSGMDNAIKEMEKIQPYVMAPLLAAYMNGADLVSLVGSGEKGWAAVDGLYADPPQSSEQCLHTEKYADERDSRTPISIPAALGVEAAGWRGVDAAIHGELYLRVLLMRHGTEVKTARKACEGWDGDMYRAWRSADGRTAIVLATTWDTVRDAQQFFDAYRMTLPKKYAKLAEEAGSDLSALQYTYGEESLGTGALVLSAREVFAVEGFGAELRTSVVAALRAMKVEHVE